LLASNVIGACVFLARASNSWAIPEEHGQVPVTGEPFVWFASIFPIVAIFFVLNFTWGGVVLARRQWKSGTLLILSALIWLVAALIDNAHH
jgi:hypothetical protein